MESAAMNLHLDPDTDADGRQLALDGMRAAEAATDVAWRKACDATIARLAATGEPFTADDVRALVGPPVAASPQAFGARFGAAHRGDVIAPVGFTTSERPERHGGVVRVWRGTAGPQTARQASHIGVR